VWINREQETSELPRAAELPDLVGLADVLDGLVSPATAGAPSTGPRGTESGSGVSPGSTGATAPP
jgi:hypothetical protein